MKKNVYINYPLDDAAIEWTRKQVPGAHVTQNGEEVLAMVRDGEVSRVCVALDALCFSGPEITPDIPKVLSGHHNSI